MYKAELIQRTQRRIEENRTQNRIAQALEKPSKVGGDTSYSRANPFSGPFPTATADGHLSLMFKLGTVDIDVGNI